MGSRGKLWLLILVITGALDARTTESVERTQPTNVIPKTSFSCRGRSGGYYADTETDCQVYHMCDEQGRQFSYACPNATLFQQRMLICDHWYMVDCSSSEANYAFNELIGQKDKQFVSQIDAEKRTPRPDLLDRPYAHDYKGESFRKQIGKSNFPALQNAITGFIKNDNRKYEILETQASSNILPPIINTNALDPTLIPSSEEFPQVDKTNGRRNALSADSAEYSGTAMIPPPTGFEPPKLLPTYNKEFREREQERLRQLGLPIQDSTQSRFANQQKNSVPLPTTRPNPVSQQSQTTKKAVVRTFDPDKNYKAFEHIFQPGKKATHKDYDFSRYFTKKENGSPTAATVERRQNLGAYNSQQTPSTVQSIVKVTQRTTTTTTTKKSFPSSTVRPFVTSKPSQVITTTKRATPAPTTRRIQSVNQIQTNNQFNRPLAPPTAKPVENTVQRVAVPARDLLPPLVEVRNYDDGTTKGPSIYAGFKVPKRGLLGPKFENDTAEAQSKRSITGEGNFSNGFQTSETRRSASSENSINVQYKDLQKLFAIPQFDFPLEPTGRIGYENSEAVNSFQVKIPYKAGKTERYYYLEHSHCNPECHPYFFKPGRCEPCIKL